MIRINFCLTIEKRGRPSVVCWESFSVVRVEVKMAATAEGKFTTWKHLLRILFKRVVIFFFSHFFSTFKYIFLKWWYRERNWSWRHCGASAHRTWKTTGDRFRVPIRDSDQGNDIFMKLLIITCVIATLKDVRRLIITRSFSFHLLTCLMFLSSSSSFSFLTMMMMMIPSIVVRDDTKKERTTGITRSIQQKGVGYLSFSRLGLNERDQKWNGSISFLFQTNQKRDSSRNTRQTGSRRG